MTLRLNGPSELAAFPAEKYAKSWFLKGGLLTDSPQQVRISEDEKKAERGERKKLKKSGPKNEEGEKVGKEVNKYMDGSKYF